MHLFLIVGIVAATAVTVRAAMYRHARKRRGLPPSDWHPHPTVTRRWAITAEVSVWLALLGALLAVVYFGPLRPLHEWFQ